MTILVTGGTGLVGPRLLKRLLAAGTECRALVRPGKELPAGVTPVEGDILDPASLAKAVAGVSAIVHLGVRPNNAPGLLKPVLFWLGLPLWHSSASKTLQESTGKILCGSLATDFRAIAIGNQPAITIF